jgi:hypothetical protein
MNISTHFACAQTPATAKQDFVERMLVAVERFGSQIRKVHVSVRDINGPRGGVDKQCRCVVHLKRMAPIVIEDADQSYLALCHRVAERVAYTLSQKIDRLSAPHRPRRQRASIDQQSLLDYVPR